MEKIKTKTLKFKYGISKVKVTIESDSRIALTEMEKKITENIAEYTIEL